MSQNVEDMVLRAQQADAQREIIKTKPNARELIREFDFKINRLLTANGDLPAVLHEIRSAHMGMDFGQEKASGLFRTAADLAAETSSLEFIVEPYVLAGACRARLQSSSFAMRFLLKMSCQRSLLPPSSTKIRSELISGLPLS